MQLWPRLAELPLPLLTCRTPTGVAATAIGDPVNFTSAIFFLLRTHTVRCRPGQRQIHQHQNTLQSSFTVKESLKKVWEEKKRSCAACFDVVTSAVNKQLKHDSSLSGCECDEAVDSYELHTYSRQDLSSAW